MPPRSLPVLLDRGWGKWFRNSEDRLERMVADVLADLDSIVRGRMKKELDGLYRSETIMKPGGWRKKDREEFFVRIANSTQAAYEQIEKLLMTQMRATYFRRRKIDLSLFTKAFPWMKVVPEGTKESEVQEAPQGLPYARLTVNAGGPSASFKNFIKQGFEPGTIPGVTLSNWGQTHLTAMRTSISKMVNQAEGRKWAKKDALRKIGNQLGKDYPPRAVEANVMRVLRTQHQKAVTWSQAEIGKMNSDIVGAMIRVAGGRACISCSVLDGKVYPLGSDLNDHPNGQCSWMYKLKTPKQMGLKVPPGLEWMNKPQPLGYTPALERFKKAKASYQKQVLGKGMYKLWKETGFDLKHLETTRGGMTAIRPLFQIRTMIAQGKIPVKAAPATIPVPGPTPPSEGASLESLKTGRTAKKRRAKRKRQAAKKKKKGKGVK